ncbi:MAG: hypothetical protein QXP48_00890 [Acidilobaceae archaeon]
MTYNLFRANVSFSHVALVALLAVNIVIIGGVVMRISYLYMTSVYTHYDWVVGVVIIVLMCIAALYGFVGYFVIIRKKLYKRVLVGAITVQTMSLIVIIAIAVDPVILLGFATSIITSIFIIASLYRAPSQ